jgi:NAD(P)-dependent dehydrogenase (short-subunit alcohol dehydrogenase family)
MAWTASDISDLAGTVAVVTGGNGGLGFETVRGLAGAGAHVVMAARNQEKARTAVGKIEAEHPGASIEVVELDLSDQQSVAQAAEAIAGRHERIDILVNNAGVMAMPESRTPDGFETQIGVNHLGHWAFTSRLLLPLLRAEAARVVTVTSTARHLSGPPRPSDPHMEGRYNAWRAYGQAKKANYHFALGLDRRFRAAGVAAMSLAAHPGLSNTDLQATTAHTGGAGFAGGFFHTLTSAVGMSAEVGARPQLRAATDPQAQGGQLYGPRFVSHGHAVVLPVLRYPGIYRQIDALWSWSQRETGVALDVDAALAALA